jgi:NitT/TauT family transport system substrate-binding protein
MAIKIIDKVMVGGPRTGRLRRLGSVVVAASLLPLSIGALTAQQAGAAALAAGSRSASPVTVNLGYFPNLTHAPALVGIASGILAKDLGPDKLNASQTFTAGSTEVAAVLAGSIDIAFIGPSPAISGFVKSNGAVRIIAGAASAGAGLVVKSSITSVSQLAGTTLVSPQLGNTQDVALRYFLLSHGYTVNGSGAKNVTVSPNATGSTGDVVAEFKEGQIDGAWVPEPYVAEMVADGGHELVNEKTLWPGGKFVTTNVIVSTSFLKAHPATVSRFLKGLVDTLAFIKAHKAQAEADANKELTALSGKALTPAVLSAAWSDLSFTVNPLAKTLKTEVAHAVKTGQLTAADSNVQGIYDLGPLNAILTKANQPDVSAAGLGS